MKYLKAFWENIKVPVLMFALFFFAGIGLAAGVANSDGYIKLLSGKALIITLVDLD